MADDYFATEHEYVLVYKKGNDFVWKDEEVEADFKGFPKSDERGKYKLVKLAKWGNTARKEDRPSMHFPIPGPGDNNILPIAPDGTAGRWRIGREKMCELLNSRLVEYKERGGQIIPYEKIYYSNKITKLKKLRSILYNIGGTSSGTNELTSIFGKKDVFENPKPTALIKSFARWNTDDDDIILDFFAGSCSTAHAVMDMNEEDGKKRRFIVVQIPEKCPPRGEAKKMGLINIADVGKFRIDRVIKKMHARGAKHNGMDLGYKYLKLDRSNFKVWDNEPKDDMETIRRQIEMHIYHIDPNASQEDILYELLLKAGFPLTTKIEKRRMADKDVFAIEDGALLICLEKSLTPELIRTMAYANPLQVICLDEGFEGNDQLKTNAAQTFKSRSEGESEHQQIVFRTV